MGATDNHNQGLLPQLSDFNVQFLLISYREMQSPNVIVTTIKIKYYYMLFIRGFKSCGLCFLLFLTDILYHSFQLFPGNI